MTRGDDATPLARSNIHLSALRDRPSKRIQHPQCLDRLSPEQRALVEALPRGPATLPDSALSAHFFSEPDAEYLNRLEKDWIGKVLRR